VFSIPRCNNCYFESILFVKPTLFLLLFFCCFIVSMDKQIALWTAFIASVRFTFLLRGFVITFISLIFYTQTELFNPKYLIEIGMVAQFGDYHTHFFFVFTTFLGFCSNQLKKAMSSFELFVYRGNLFNWDYCI